MLLTVMLVLPNAVVEDPVAQFTEIVARAQVLHESCVVLELQITPPAILVVGALDAMLHVPSQALERPVALLASVWTHLPVVSPQVFLEAFMSTAVDIAMRANVL